MPRRRWVSQVPDSAADRQMARTRDMAAYKASTLIDFERGQDLELEGLFLEPLRQARAGGGGLSAAGRLVRSAERN